MHRVHARRASRVHTQTGFVTNPEPQTIGIVSRGQQLVTGKFLFSGLLVEDRNLSIWQIARSHETVAEEIHACAWLDDLAALGDERARSRAQKWVFTWIGLFGEGEGPGWTPAIVGGRLTRWIDHAMFLLHGQEQPAADDLIRSLAQQTRFLARRWKVLPVGLPRFEALAGLIRAGLALRGMEGHVAPAVRAMAADCAAFVDPDGALASRKPEDLLTLLRLLNQTSEALADTGKDVPHDLSRAIFRIAPTLRALRHADGSLARFHGGGRGLAGQADQALAASGVKDLPAARTHMGFARLSVGRTTLIADASAPPGGSATIAAHASTLAFELTSGRRPLVVNCGSGARFGHEWRRASRATASHSTLALAGMSSSRLAPPNRFAADPETLTDVPGMVLCNITEGTFGRRLEMSHDGYRASHGLTHARILELTPDGRSLSGEDLLATLEPHDDTLFDRVKGGGLAFTLRFHLHPEVAVRQDGTTVRMTLRSGETWVFDHDQSAELSLAPSVYLQNGRMRPVATQQVVLSGRAIAYGTRVRWSLAKADETPDVVRDLAEVDLPDPVC